MALWHTEDDRCHQETCRWRNAARVQPRPFLIRQFQWLQGMSYWTWLVADLRNRTRKSDFVLDKNRNAFGLVQEVKSPINWWNKKRRVTVRHSSLIFLYPIGWCRSGLLRYARNDTPKQEERQDFSYRSFSSKARRAAFTPRRERSDCAHTSYKLISPSVSLLIAS